MRTPKIMTSLGTAALCLAISCITCAQTPQEQQTQNQLSPEVAQILLNPQAPAPDVLKQDVYTGLLTLDAPSGVDYIEVGAQTILCQFASYEKAIAAQDNTAFEQCKEPKDHYSNQQPLQINLSINCQDLNFPCKPLNADHCIAQILEHKQDYAVLFEKNSTLLERYSHIQQLAYHHSYLYDINTPMPPYHYLVRLSELRLAQATIAFNENNANEGFRLLTEEIKFSKRMLAQDSTLIGKMIALVQLYNGYHTLSALLDSPQMQPYLHDQRLLALLALPTPEEQTAMAHLENELQFAISYAYNFSQNDIDKLLNPLPGFEEYLYPGLSKAYHQALKASGMTPEQFLETHYDRYTSAELDYQLWQPLLHKATLNMGELAILYQNKQFQLPTAKELLEQNRATNINDKNAQTNNLLGEMLFDSAANNEMNKYDDYLSRFYDYLVYRHLVHLKHQIISAKLKTGEVNAFLQKAGKAAHHPITGEPFTWNEKEQTLNTPWMADHPPVGGRGDRSYKAMETMSVHIPLKN